MMDFIHKMVNFALQMMDRYTGHDGVGEGRVGRCIPLEVVWHLFLCYVSC